MSKDFIGYYQPSKDDFADLWKNGTIIIDANVLLNLYRYPASARDDMLRVFEKFKGKLWLPHQAMLEYQENRLGVIADQRVKFRGVKKLIYDTQDNFRNKLEELQLRKRSNIDPDKYLKSLNDIYKQFEVELDNLFNGQMDVSDEDEIRIQIMELLGENIGECPFDQKWLDDICKEGEQRYLQRIPPGYKDNEKSQGGEPCHHCGGLSFERKYGDLIMWFEIIEYAKQNSLDKIIFLTDDNKGDWFWNVDSDGKKTIGPKPFLVNEIHRKSNVKLFYMYTTEQFIKYAKEKLQFQVKPESIKQIKEATDKKIPFVIEPSGIPSTLKIGVPTIRDILSEDVENSLKRNVFDWLVSTFPCDNITDNTSHFDIVRISSDDHIFGYDFKGIGYLAQRSLDSLLIDYYYIAARYKLHGWNIIIPVSSSHFYMDTLIRRLKKDNIPDNVVISIVRPSSGSEYKTVYMLGSSSNCDWVYKP
ncbi:PIN-like domain-containing protein [Dehalococcoides mccartyi]|jgi:hypothetical protein|uniref:PIN-like domain-containing protein n=1 Tax=Dehalococcoides mccartyi TaxID=61435 RepID=UPI0003C885C5|nr:PIN-like domain-containing protein [Dehalococcoides mccartyi]AHB14245.1 hypothetical protein GY50_1476 [Dehalococcoides mccartyi GY50]